MPTPSPPSAIWGPLIAGGPPFAVDPPVIQDATFRVNQSYIAYLDSQVRGLETHVLQSLLSGLTATWRVLDGASAAGAAGDIVVLAGSTALTVTRVTAGTIAAAGMAFGVLLQGAVPGGAALIALHGTIPPSITGLTTGGGSYVRVNTSTARLQVVPTFAASDYPMGVIDGAANLTLAIGLPPNAIPTGQLTIINVNATGTGGRQVSPFTATAGQTVVCRMTEGAVTVKLPDALSTGQSVTVAIEDGQATGGTLTITTVHGVTTLAQPSPNNGTAVTSIAIASAAANSGLLLTWFNGGASDGRYLLA